MTSEGNDARGYIDLLGIPIREFVNADLAGLRQLASQATNSFTKHLSITYLGAYLIPHRHHLTLPSSGESDARENQPPDLAYLEVCAGTRLPAKGLVPLPLHHPNPIEYLQGSFDDPNYHALSMAIRARSQQQGITAAFYHGTPRPDLETAVAEYADFMALVWAVVAPLRNSLEQTLARLGTDDWDHFAKAALQWLRREADLRCSIFRVDFAASQPVFVDSSDNIDLPFRGELSRMITKTDPYTYESLFGN